MDALERQLGNALFAHTQDAVVVVDTASLRIQRVNPAFCKLSGYEASALDQRSLTELLEVERQLALAQIFGAPDAAHHAVHERARLKTQRGPRIPLTVTCCAMAKPGEPWRVLLLRTETVREWNDRRQQRHNDILELIATGKPLKVVLEAIVALIESDTPEAKCSILLLDESGRYLHDGSSPKLPQFYRNAIHGIAIGPTVGSCGAAAYTRQRVVVTEIASHPNWESFRVLAQQAELRACWSEPILAASGRALGTFAIYHCEPHTPTERECEAVALCTHLASIAIERHQATESLARSQQMLRTVLDNIPQGVFWKDAQSKYLGCNRVVAESFGLAEPAAIIGLSDDQLFGLTSEQAQFFMRKDREVIESNRPEMGIVEPATLANGKTIWMETNKLPLHDSAGQVIGILGTWQDITQRKVNDEALRASEERLSAMARAMPQALYIYDLLEQRTIYINREIWHDLGYSKDDMEAFGGDMIQQLLHPDDRAQMQTLLTRWDTATEATILEVEYRMRHRSGDWRWFLGRDAVYQRTPEGRVRQIVGTTRDITEAKQAQEQLARSEKQYRDLVETSHDLIWSVDREGRWTFLNQRGARAIYGCDAEEMLGRPFTDFLSVAQAAKDLTLFARLLDGEPVFDYETEHRRRDGTPVMLRFNALPLLGPTGQIIGTTGTAIDVTERLRTLEALRQSERYLRTILDTEPECVKLLAADGTLLDMNLAGLAMIDADALEVVKGHCVYPLIDAAFLPAFQHLMQRVFAGQTERLAFRITTLKGRIRWLDMHAVPLKDSTGSVHTMLSVTRDITDNRQTEEELRANKAILEGVSRLQREFMVESGSANHSFERMMELLLTTTSSEYGFIAELQYQPDHKPYLRAYAITNIAWDDATRRFYDENLLNGLEFHNLATLFGATITTRQLVIANDPAHDPRRGGMPPGHPPLRSFLGIPLFHGDELLGMVGLANRDLGFDELVVAQVEPIISTCASLVYAFRLNRERAAAEEHRRQLEAKMQQTAKLESLGVLAGGIAHDFNNLLTSILGYSDLALVELPADSTARLLIEEAVNGTRRAAELTKQMLAYSGKGRFVIEPLDVSVITQDMARLLQISISKRCTLRYQLAPDLPSVEADVVQLRQIIMNLIINASEAIGEQTGTITITTGTQECVRADLSTTYLDDTLAEGTYVFLEVADTGTGMTPETRAKIFDPFFTTKFTGRGLGLSAVMGIVRGHRGAIQCTSTVGQGTTFRVLLPASKQSPVVHEPLSKTMPVWHGTGTVLVVDDEDSVLQLTKHMLERMGFTVLTAPDGQAALDIFQAHVPTIRFVLLDMMMPHMNGAETFAAMQQIIPDLKAILTSGYNEQTVTRDLTGQGLAGFVQKPFTYEQLIEVVQRVLHESS